MLRPLLGFISLLLLAQQVCIAQINYVDIAQEVGLAHVAAEPRVGAGISFYDFDQDGDDDISIATTLGRKPIFFENKEGSFEQIPSFIDNVGDSKQILWVDFDNDGDKDLFLTNFGSPNRLYAQISPGQFEDITRQAGLWINDNWGYGAVWGDYNRDGWLDLYVNERRSLVFPEENKNRLFQNQGDGTFQDVTEYTGVADFGKIPFVSAFFDANNDKWPDIYTANDKLTRNTLFLNRRNGRFFDFGPFSSSDKRMNAMCVAIGDYNRDGWQDIYVSNTPIGNALFTNLGSLYPDEEVVFQEDAIEKGVGFFGNGWGSNFLDADNDGDLDLYASGSIVGASQVSSLFYEQAHPDSFTECTTGFLGDTTTSFSNAIGDFNGDGIAEILVQNNPPFPYQLWQNQTVNDNNWLKLDLQGVKSNRDAIGARIEIFTGNSFQMRYTHCGIGFLAQNSATEIIGLGSYSSVDSIHIIWPTGHVDQLYDVPANQRILVEEGSSTNGQIDVDEDIQLLSTYTNYSLSSKPAFKIYPNPAKSRLYLQSDEQVGSIHYEIYDLHGKLQYKAELPIGIQDIEIKDLNEGAYFLKIFEAQNHTLRASLPFVRVW